jgi:hypothetical protein
MTSSLLPLHPDVRDDLELEASAGAGPARQYAATILEQDAYITQLEHAINDAHAKVREGGS